LRYKGQGYELNVPFGPEMAAQFHDLHQRRYGFANEMRALEVVNVRVRMVSAAEAFEPVAQPLQEGDGSHALMERRLVYFDGSFQETRVYDRDLLRPGDSFAGPAIVAEYSSATILPPGDVLRVDGLRNLVIEVH
jgi:N-methylhydantoinase A